MAYIVTLPDGKQKFVRSLTLQELDAIKAQGNSVSEVADSQWTTDAGGQVMVSAAAYQQAQAIATGFQFAAAQRALESNQISAYGQMTSRIGQMVPLLGQSQNYGLLANVTAGDPSAPYLSVPAGLARLAGPSPVQPDYASLKTYQSKDVSDFASKVQAQEMTSAEKQDAGSTKGMTGATEAPKSATQPAATDATGADTTRSFAIPVRGDQTGPIWSPEAGRYVFGRSAESAAQAPVAVANGAGSVPGPLGSATTAAPGTVPTATQTFSNQGVQATALLPEGARSEGGRGGQSAWESRRDALLGGQRHDDFQMAHSVTAQQLNDVAKIGDESRRKREFQRLMQRPAWTPETSHGSNWRSEDAGEKNPYTSGDKSGGGFDYNAAPVARESDRDRRARQAAKRASDPQRNRATGGTDVVKPAMFKRAAGGTDPLGLPPMPDLGGGLPPNLAAPMPGGQPMGIAGLPFDPHDPNQPPERMQEIAEILAAPPSPSPSALEAAVRECWSLGPDGVPIYTKNYEEAASQGVEALPDGGLDIPPDANDLALGGPMSSDGLPPLPPPGGPMGGPGEQPSMFKRGGTRRLGGGGTVGPGGTPSGTVTKKYPSATDYRGPAPATVPVVNTGWLGQNTSVAPPAPNPDWVKQPTTAAPAPATVKARPRTRQAAGTTGGGGGAAGPAGPSAAEMPKIVGYYIAQFGGDEAAARADLNSGSAESQQWLKSALGMARAGELDAYGTTPAPAAAPAAPAESPWKSMTPEQRAASVRTTTNQAGRQPSATPNPASPWTSMSPAARAAAVHTTTSPPRPTTAAHGAGSAPGPTTPPNPAIGRGIVNHLKEAIANMTPEEATAYVRRMLEVTMGGNAGPLQGMPVAAQLRQRAMGGTDEIAVPSTGRAGTAPVYDYGEGDVRMPLQPGPFAQPGWLEDALRPIGDWVSDRSYDLGLARGGTVPTLNGPTTFVAERPTLFNAGNQHFQVGEGDYKGRPGADELVSVTSSPQGLVVHVDPLQRSDTGIPEAVAATANLAVPGSPYKAKAGPPASPTGVGHMAQGGTRTPGRDPLVAVPYSGYASQGGPIDRFDPGGHALLGSVGHPTLTGGGEWVGDPFGGGAGGGGRRLAVPIPTTPYLAPYPDAINRNAVGGTRYVPMTDGQWLRRRALGGTDYLGPQAATGASLPETLTTLEGVTLQRQPDGSYLPLDAPQAQPPMPPAAPPMAPPGPPMAMARGGTGVVSPYGKVVRPGTAPSATGQVTVPGANRKTVTTPWYQAQPYVPPEYTLARDVANTTPEGLDQLGQLSQHRAGIPLSQWEAMRQRGIKGLTGPVPVGGMARGF